MNHLSVPALILLCLIQNTVDVIHTANTDLIKKKKIMWKDYLFTSITIYTDNEEEAIWSLYGHLT